MTEVLSKEFSRTGFLRGGGALIVSAGVVGSGLLAGRAGAAASPFESNGPLPLDQVDSFLAVHADNTVSLFMYKKELGQGTTTGTLQIVAEELDVELSQLKTVRIDTNRFANQGSTVASNGIQVGGRQIRAAAAHARRALLQLASQQLGVPVASLTVSGGVVAGGGRSVRYGDLIGEKVFNVVMNPAVMHPGESFSKPVSQYRIVTTVVPRVDIPDKVSGQYVYMQNVRVPGMLHGRVVRPRGQPAWGTGAPIVSLDESSIRSIEGARVVRRGDFLAVVAPTEYAAVQAAAQLKVTWKEDSSLPSNGNLFSHMRGLPTTNVVLTTEVGNLTGAFARAAKTLTATYKVPYQSHNALAPNCAIADVTASGATVFCSTQNVYGTRTKVMNVTGLPQDKVRVVFYEGGSCYGQNLHEESAVAAAVISQIVGKPVRVQFMRWDEHGWGNSEPPHLIDVRAGIDNNGKITAFDFTSTQHGWKTSVEVSQALTGASPWPNSGMSQGATAKNGGGVYNAAEARRVVNRWYSGLLSGSLPGTNLRSPTDLAMHFASEQMADALAYEAKIDPVAFRRLNIDSTTAAGARWLGVLDAATNAAGYKPKTAASNLSKQAVVSGRGVGFGAHTAAHAAVVADIEVNKQTGKIVVKHSFAAMDVGLAVNPELVANQIVGQQIMAASRALLEEVRFTKKGVTSTDWVSYPILRFQDAPNVTPIVVQRKDLPSEGAGEESMSALVAAIANAFFDATGVRLDRQPMNPGYVRAALKAAGVT
jgi:CO/xanthine dehydrogenase Mo-binding subunit